MFEIEFFTKGLVQPKAHFRFHLVQRFFIWFFMLLRGYVIRLNAILRHSLIMPIRKFNRRFQRKYIIEIGTRVVFMIPFSQESMSDSCIWG